MTPLLPFSSQIKASLPLVSALVGQHPDVVLTKEEKLKNRPQATTPTKCKGPLVIDLCSPETRPAVDIKPLTTPKKLKLEGLLVIDLSSPLESPNSVSETKPTIDIKPPITPTKPKDPRPLVIDLCSPETKPAITRGSVVEAPRIVRVGSIYPSLEEAQEAIYTQENCLGHVWRRSQGTKSSNGSQKKLTFRCNHYHHPTPTHSGSIDPSDHHKGKSIKTNCMAHVNVNRIQNSTLWHITLANWDHNHEREIPLGGTIRHPPTLEQ